MSAGDWLPPRCGHIGPTLYVLPPFDGCARTGPLPIRARCHEPQGHAGPHQHPEGASPQDKASWPALAWDDRRQLSLFGGAA